MLRQSTTVYTHVKTPKPMHFSRQTNIFWILPICTFLIAAASALQCYQTPEGDTTGATPVANLTLVNCTDLYPDHNPNATDLTMKLACVKDDKIRSCVLVAKDTEMICANIEANSTRTTRQARVNQQHTRPPPPPPKKPQICYCDKDKCNNAVKLDVSLASLIAAVTLLWQF